MISYVIISIVGVVMTVLDQITKVVICNVFPNGQSTAANEIVVIENFFDVVRWHNTGGAWGVLGDYTWLLCVMTVICIGFVLYAYICADSKLLKLSLMLILSGAVGNLIDRLRLGYVVDFLSFDNLFGYSFPAFNVADICVTAGTIGIIIFLLFLSKKTNAFRKGTLPHKFFDGEDVETSQKVTGLATDISSISEMPEETGEEK